MKKFKKIFKTVNDFLFEVLIGMTLVWGMYLAIVFTIEIPHIGIPIMVFSVLLTLYKRKVEKWVNQP